MFLVALAVLASRDARAISSIGDARVSMIDDLPCFSVPGTRTTVQSIRLHALTVTQTERTDWRSLPTEMWGFTIDDPLGMPLGGSPESCIRYGKPPSAARVHGDAIPLESSRVYRVEIDARGTDQRGTTLGYEIEFCVATVRGGATEVRMIAWDEKARRWRTEVCRPGGVAP